LRAEVLYDRVEGRLKRDVFKQMIAAYKDLQAQRVVRQLQHSVTSQSNQLKQVSQVSKHYISLQTLINLTKLNHKVVMKRALDAMKPREQVEVVVEREVHHSRDTGRG